MKQQNMINTTSAIMKSAVLVVLAVFTMAVGHVAAQDKTAVKSRVTVVANDVKTNIWVSDFPKNASIVVYDVDNNLITLTTTNNFGATFISLPQGLKTGVVVKTLDGQVSASNSPIIKNKQPEQNIVVNNQDDSNKA